jgi:hypothetical protein
MTISGFDGNTWRTGKNVQVFDGVSWRAATGVWVFDGAVWRRSLSNQSATSNGVSVGYLSDRSFVFYTVECWLKPVPESFAANNAEAAIWGVDTAQNNAIQFQFQTSLGTLYLAVRYRNTAGTWVTTLFYNWGSLTAPATPEWRHLAVRMSSAGSYNVYVNGLIVHNFTALLTTLNPDSPSGGFFAAFNNAFLIDELRQWATVRTPAEIQDNRLLDLTKTGTPPGVYFQMNAVQDGDRIPNTGSSHPDLKLIAPGPSVIVQSIDTPFV